MPWVAVIELRDKLHQVSFTQTYTGVLVIVNLIVNDTFVELKPFRVSASPSTAKPNKQRFAHLRYIC